MTGFLNALKADLLDRRLVPFVALVLVALAGAVAYVAVGGGSTSTTPAAAVPTAPATAPVTGGLAVSQTTPEKAVAETTDGVAAQRRGMARNPFALLPQAAAAKARAAAASTSAGTSAPSSGSGSATSGSSSGSGSATPGSSSGSGSATPGPSSGSGSTTPSGTSPQQTVYHVSVLFGVAPTAGATPPSSPLTPYANLKLLTPLPSAKSPQLIFRGVTVGGKSATFTVVSEAILHGGAACLPSPVQCRAIDLKPRQSEQLEYTSLTGVTTIYELKVVSIASAKGTTAAVKALLRGRSHFGLELLRMDGLMAIPFLRNSTQVGVLVFTGRRALAARAHTAGQPGVAG
jgi:hypothetical protein